MCRCATISICAVLHIYVSSHGNVGRISVYVWVEVSAYISIGERFLWRAVVVCLHIQYSKEKKWRWLLQIPMKPLTRKQRLSTEGNKIKIKKSKHNKDKKGTSGYHEVRRNDQIPELNI